MSGKNWAFLENAFLFCFFLMIQNCRFDLIQHLLFPDDNTQCQPFDQLFHHGIQERNLVETDSCLIQKMEDCHIFYNSIVCMLEFPMPAQRLVRCMTIFTRGFHVYGSHCHPHNDSSNVIIRFRVDLDFASGCFMLRINPGFIGNLTQVQILLYLATIQEMVKKRVLQGQGKVRKLHSKSRKISVFQRS